ncbi:MAG: SusC/RagA family TonB-linked outer membrane protein [Bacteroidota bacterium]
MMKHLVTKLCGTLVVFLLLTGFAAAQFTATGTVTDEKDVPLIGVSVAVKNTSLGTVTNLDGEFSLNVPGNSAVLVFSYVGYEGQETTVSSGSPSAAVVMTEGATQLDEIVVTGLASSVKRSNLANSVASISSKELTGVTTQSTMDGALYGKFKGAEIRSNSGAPGGGISVKLRGVTSVFGDQQPLYIVDGVYVDNSSITSGTNIVSEAAGGGNTSTNQDDASNRIADIDPEDIESIEILKGASAAAIYGSRAAGGVVIITTKKGQAGATKVTFSQAIGIVQPTRLLGTRDWDRATVVNQYSEAVALEFDANPFVDYEAALFDNTGILSTSRLNISGGNEKTNFFVGATYKNDDGIVDNTGYQKASARVNVGHKFNDWLDIYVTTNYINSHADRGFFNNGNTNATVGYGLAFTRPWDVLEADADGVYPANPRVGSNVLETVAITTNRESINRFIGGATANVRLFSNDQQNLKMVLRAGMDQYLLRTTSIFPQELSFYRDPGTLGGVAISGSTENTNVNMSAILVHSYFTSEGLSFRTQLGVTQEDFNQNTVITTATGLNGSQTNVDQAANVSGFQNREPQKDKGFFVQEEVNWKDRLIFTVGVRADKSSNNGDQNKLYWYPKANIAFNLHEFDFWTVDVLNQVKLRFAYGQAGRFANFPDRFNALSGTLIGTSSGLQAVTLLGNTTVEPERQSETEFGVDLGFLDGRVNLDFTYYIKTIDDLLLRQQIPTSTGYTRKVVNAGALRNNGVEIGLNATPVKGKVTWNTGVNFWKNKSEITRLDIPAFNLGGFAASLGQYRIQEGQSATQIVGTLNPSDCATADCSDLDPDGDGFRVYGDAEADFNMSFPNSISVEGFELSFLFHWKKGGDGVNLSTLLYDLAGTTWDYDDITLDPEGTTGNGDFRLNSWFAGDTGPWVEDAGYLRLREIGLYYTIPRSVFNDKASMKVGVSGTNLINIFDYNSYDPEVSNFGNNVLANTIEVTPFPAAKTLNFHLSATF